MIRPMLFVGGGKICLRFQVDDQAGAILRVGEQRIKLDVIQNRTLRYRFVLRVVALDLFRYGVEIGQGHGLRAIPASGVPHAGRLNLFLGAVPIFRHTPCKNRTSTSLQARASLQAASDRETVFPNRQRRVQCFIRHDVHPPPSIVFALYRKVVNFSITRRTSWPNFAAGPFMLTNFLALLPTPPAQCVPSLPRSPDRPCRCVGAAGQLIGIVA